MTAIERTAYPRFAKGRYRKQQLQLYEPTLDEINYMSSYNIRTDQQRLNFMVQLKTFQQFYYFPSLKEVPSPIVKSIRQSLNITKPLKPHCRYSDTAARHRIWAREYLAINVDSELHDKKIISITTIAAKA